MLPPRRHGGTLMPLVVILARAAVAPGVAEAREWPPPRGR